MQTDPDRIHNQRHAEVGHLIEVHAETLVSRWYRRALEEQPTAPGGVHEELRDHLFEFLRAMGRDLQEDRSDSPLLASIQAVRHGEQRWQSGWQLTELVRDYQIMRLVIVDFLDEFLPRQVNLEEAMAVGLALDEAIAAAVKMYVAHQVELAGQNEVSLREAIELAESANRAKGDVLAHVSHELRTPMNSILGMAQLALEEPLSPVTRDVVTTIKNSADMLLSLLNELLDYSRLESGRLELDPHSFSLRTVLDETLRTLAVRADEKHLEMVCDVPSTIPDLLIGDSYRLRQVITNLVSNAIKFTNEGEVTVQVARALQSSGCVTLEFIVSDTGIGIELAAQQAIFEPFAQANSATARQYGGTGLGLPIAKELTSRMGGRLWVDSQPGRGSQFHFTARFKLDPGGEKPAFHASVLDQLQGVRALVVDDHAPTRRIVVEALEEWGMHVASADGAASANAAIQSAVAADRAFQLLIVDAVMPHQSGFDVVEQLRTLGCLPPHVMMMFSHSDRTMFVSRAQSLAIDSYLIKPVSAMDLLATVLDTLRLTPAHQRNEATPEELPTGPARRVLLAEDTPANQKIFKALLTRRHFDVTTVDNGQDALQAVQGEVFDVVLMDLQMPVLDGLKASAQIRAWEKKTGRARVPIVALTAHALPRDQERCLAAGMDDYLTKPIDVEKLKQVLDRLTYAEDDSMTTKRASALHITPDSSEEPLINRQNALQRLGGNDELFTELVGFFLEDAPQLLERVRNGIAGGDTSDAKIAAHSLKGLASNFDGFAAMRAAARVEELADDPAAVELPRAAETLAAEIDRLSNALLPYKP